MEGRGRDQAQQHLATAARAARPLRAPGGTATSTAWASIHSAGMDHQKAVAQNRAALEATIEFGARKLRTAVWAPAAGSQAAAELAPPDVRADGSPWGENPARTAYAAANLMMLAVLDDLASLHRLLGEPMPVIGPTLVARSVAEIAWGAWWLMEPGIGARARVCRELVHSLTSARRAGQVAGEFLATGWDVGDEIKDASQQEARVLKRIAELKIAAPSAGYSPVIEGEQAEPATTGTARMLRLVLPPNIPATSVYRTYSAVMHGEIYGLMNFMEPGVTSDGTPLVHWHLRPELLDSTVQLAIAAFGRAWKHIAEVMGWGKIAGDLWEVKLRNVYLGLRE